MIFVEADLMGLMGHRVCDFRAPESTTNQKWTRTFTTPHKPEHHTNLRFSFNLTSTQCQQSKRICSSSDLAAFYTWQKNSRCLNLWMHSLRYWKCLMSVSDSQLWRLKELDDITCYYVMFQKRSYTWFETCHVLPPHLPSGTGFRQPQGGTTGAGWKWSPLLVLLRYSYVQRGAGQEKSREEQVDDLCSLHSQQRNTVKSLILFVCFD